MSKTKELLEAFAKGLKNPGKVVEGWTNIVKMELGALPEDQLAEVARRRLICGHCEFQSENAKKKGYETKRNDPHCILCSCPIQSKTASLSSICGAKYWNEQHPDQPALEIKWKEYESEEA